MYIFSLYFDISVRVNIKESLNMIVVGIICKNIAKKPAYFDIYRGVNIKELLNMIAVVKICTK